MTLFVSKGSEMNRQEPLFPAVPCPAGQLKPVVGRFAARIGLVGTLTTPATCGQDCSRAAVEQFTPVCGAGELASGAKSEPKSTPEEAVESFEAIVLLTIFTAK